MRSVTGAPDVLIVGLGSTFGLRTADEALAGSLRRAGAEVELVFAARPREVRTLAATDWIWATAARRAAIAALDRLTPRAIVYCTTTAALRWPAAGAIRFDAPAAGNRPGRHGLWQRPVERSRLAQAPLLIPQSAGALAEAGSPRTPSLVVPVAVEPSGPGDQRRDIAAITYAANPAKKGLDTVLAAWRSARGPGEELVVAGLSGPAEAGVSYSGPLDQDRYRALVRRARVFVTAPQREDYGLAQLEALADGCRVVTTPAPGPYAALPLLRAGLGWVVPEHGLRASLRAALDDDEPGYGERALTALRPFRRDAVDRIVAAELLPALLEGG